MEIKFLKDKKKIFIMAASLLLCISIFLVIYLVTYNLNKLNSDVNFVNKNNYEIMSKNNIRELVIVNENSEGEFLESNRIKLELSDINKIFNDMYPIGGYEIIDFNDKAIILKEVNNKKFDPNMYYIGEKDGYITVFKSDEDGNLFIEDEFLDISSKKVESLPIADRELVVNYELKSNEREDVQDMLSELET